MTVGLQLSLQTDNFLQYEDILQVWVLLILLYPKNLSFELEWR